MALSDYDVVTDSGTGTGPISVAALGDGRPGFGYVVLTAHYQVVTSTPGWTFSTNVLMNGGVITHRSAYCIWDGVTDDPDSFAPEFDSDDTNWAAQTGESLPPDYPTMSWAAVAYLFDDPLAAVTAGPSGSGTGVRVGSTLTVTPTGAWPIADETFQLWHMSAGRKGTTGTISGSANSPLANFITAQDNSVTADYLSGSPLTGEWIVGLSHEPQTNHTSTRSFTVGFPTGSGLGAGASDGTRTYFVVQLVEPTELTRRWWVGVVGWGGTYDPGEG